MGYWDVEVDGHKVTSFFNKKNAPKNIAKRTTVEYKSMPLSELRERGTWNRRLDKLISFLPKDAWIAGGFLRAMIAGEDETDGDIDYFFHTDKAFEKMFNLIKQPTSTPGAEKIFGYYKIPEYGVELDKLRIVDCESVATFRPNIQLVRLFWFDDPVHVIDSFDFTVCQFVTDGKTLFYNPQSFEDVKNKVIRIHRENSDAIMTLNRILKYMSKGYRIEPQTFAQAEKNAVAFLNNSEEIAKYFLLDKTESEFHRRPASFLYRAWEYLETAPISAEAFVRAKNPPKKKIDKVVRQDYSYHGS